MRRELLPATANDRSGEFAEAAMLPRFLEKSDVHPLDADQRKRQVIEPLDVPIAHVSVDVFRAPGIAATIASPRPTVASPPTARSTSCRWPSRPARAARPVVSRARDRRATAPTWRSASSDSSALCRRTRSCGHLRTGRPNLTDRPGGGERKFRRLPPVELRRQIGIEPVVEIEFVVEVEHVLGGGAPDSFSSPGYLAASCLVPAIL